MAAAAAAVRQRVNGNGVANGKSNGVNGVNGTNGTNGSPSKQLMDESTQNGKTESDLYEEHLWDRSGVKEFGGVPGTFAAMIGFPLIMWYLWIGMEYYEFQLPTPKDGQTLSEFVVHLYHLAREGATPTLWSFGIYWGFSIVQAIFYVTLPGVWAKGNPIDSYGGRRLDYYCNAVWSLYTTLAILGAMHFSGFYKLQNLVDDFGPLLSTAIFSGIGMSFFFYIKAHVYKRCVRMTGSHIYDFWMGAELCPRIGDIFDFKMYFEVRLPWFILFIISLACAAKQKESFGYVTPEMWFLCLAHWLYVNATGKGEELIVTTFDMSHEKLGFMLTFWNMAGVPLTYCNASLYLAKTDPSHYAHSKPVLFAFFTTLLVCYYIFDTCNSQKNRFRQMEKGTLIFRKTFPQLPWQTIHNPTFIRCKNGGTLLTSGWYRYARKIHYTVDTIGMITWGLITGYKSPIPYFLPVFFVVMILHRASRDLHRCKLKYGDDWEEYKKICPYLFIPYIW